MLDDDNLRLYGTPLEPLDQETVPSKKPIYVQDQIVTDENGKRRFHGAFTGGFSAGFWNTVGSLEGWTPQEFKSSRGEKAPHRQQQRPIDFMDSEDLGEFGIAPQRVQTRDDFANENVVRKRKLMQPSNGPIPGTPVLEQLLKPVADKIAVRILKSMGWRPGQGVGPRQTRRQKKKTRRHNERELYLMQRYGCELAEGAKKVPAGTADGSSSSDDDEAEDDENAITFAPDDFEPFLCAVKNNWYGLGYSGLSREPVLSQGGKATAAPEHINLFQQPLEALGKNNKKLSISGQAFGVGALEEEDDDIYARDDMTKYDFSLDERGVRREKKKPELHIQDRMVIDGFVEARRPVPQLQRFLVDLPRDFVPRDWAVRRSRFTPLGREQARALDMDFKRSSLDPSKRGEILGEEPHSDPPSSSISTIAKPQPSAEPNRAKALLDRISSKSGQFTQGGIITAEGKEMSAAKPVSVELELERKDLLAKASNKTKCLASSTITSGAFKPFLSDDSKQRRYEAFLAANLHTEEEIGSFLRTIRPVHLSEWELEMEKKEFMQARSIYKPLDGLMSDRFVSEATIEVEKPPEETVAQPAEKKKITMERTKTIWKPAALLCKRYNIAEPFGGALVAEKQPKRAKLSVFDYLETSVNTKSNFRTPVIIPKLVEHPLPIIVDPDRPSALPVLEQKLPLSESETVAVSAPKMVTPTAPVRATRIAAKTELEKRSVVSMDKPASEKIDLFRAIFDDSDDEELKAQEPQPTQEEQQATGQSKPLSAAAANLLRNASPPRGLFAALFTAPIATVTTASEAVIKTTQAAVIPTVEKPQTGSVGPPPKIAFKSRSERLQASQKVDSDTTLAPPTAPVQTPSIAQTVETYGPKLPQTVASETSARPDNMPEEQVDAAIFRLLKRQTSKRQKTIVEEEWVEKVIAAASSDSSSDSESSTSTSDDDHSHRATSAKRAKSKSKAKLKSKSKSKSKSKKKRESKHCERKSKKRDKKHEIRREKSHKSKKSKKR